MTADGDDDEGTGNEWVSTSWAEIEAFLDDKGYREGFVRVFLEFRGAVLDDMPLDGRGRPEVVNQSNFARHFGVAVSTFNRWLGTWGGSEFAHLSPGGTAAAKGRQKAKASKKAQADAAQQTRRMVADDATGFMDQLDVHKLDQSMWWLNCKILADSDLPQRQKAKVAQEWLEFLDEEAKAIEAARDELLRALTEAEEHAA